MQVSEAKIQVRNSIWFDVFHAIKLDGIWFLEGQLRQKKIFWRGSKMAISYVRDQNELLIDFRYLSAKI